MEGHKPAGISCYKIFLRDLLSSHVKMKYYVTSHSGMLEHVDDAQPEYVLQQKEAHDILFKLKRADT